MLRVLCLLLCVAMAAAAASSAADGDRVTNLPGMPSDAPKFDQYSGYLNVPGTEKQMHYWFVESQNDPASDPIVLWLNGGPGCSSLDGFLSEHGPFHVNNDGKTLYTNPYSWNQVANVIYLESPVGVGFSYSTNEEDYTIDDFQTASDNLAALKAFFVRFPDFLSNDFFISGESYGGVYVPMLVKSVLASSDGLPPLKGMLVGNGAHTYEGMAQAAPPFAFAHGLIGPAIQQQLAASCDGNYWNNTSTACREAMEAMEEEIGSDLNPYNILASCYEGDELARVRTGKFMPVRGTREHMFSRLRGAVGCIDTTQEHQYLNSEAVQEALHVQGHDITWWVCSNRVNYQRKVFDMAPYYKSFLGALRIILYHGDVDTVCPLNMGQAFVQGLPLGTPGTRRAWEATVDGVPQIAGYVRSYDKYGFSLTSIRGSGHMVPQYKPLQAFAMFERFLANKPL